MFCIKGKVGVMSSGQEWIFSYFLWEKLIQNSTKSNLDAFSGTD